MKIIVIDPIASVPYYDYSLCKALTENGCNVELITCPFKADPDFNFYGIKHKLFFFPWVSSYKLRDNTKWLYKLYQVVKGIEYIKDIFRLLIYIKKNHADIIHLQWSELPSVDVIWLILLKKMGFKLVYTAHNILPHEEKPKHKLFYNFLYNIFDRVIVHSLHDKKQLSSQFDIIENKIAVIPHGNLNIHITDKSLSKIKARDKLGIRQQDIVALFFGLILPYKGIEYLLNAWNKIALQNSHWHLIVAGKKFMSLDTIEMNPKHITFHNCFIPFEMVPYYFTASDVVILPYTKTYNSGVLHLAYSFGVPVIASRVGGISEVLEEGNSGFLVEPSNVDELADTIKKALSNKSMLKKMGKYAKCLSDSKYSWENISQHTLKIYEDVKKD